MVEKASLQDLLVKIDDLVKPGAQKPSGHAGFARELGKIFAQACTIDKEAAKKIIDRYEQKTKASGIGDTEEIRSSYQVLIGLYEGTFGEVYSMGFTFHTPFRQI